MPRAETVARRSGLARLPLATTLQGAAVASLSLCLLAHAWVARYVRYVADDYSIAGLLRDHGFVGGQVSWYQSWSGRFSATAADLGAVWLGPGSARIVPVALLVLWLVALIWAVYEVGRAAGLRLPRLSVVLVAEVVLVSTLLSIPDVFESVYWMTGALTYLAPLVLGTVLVGVVARALTDPARHRTITAIAAAVLAWGAGGFDDTYVCAQTAVIVIALVLTVRGRAPRLRAVRGRLLAAFAGSSAALLLVALAPGNAVREAYFPPHPSPAWVASWSMTMSAWLTVHTVIRATVLIAALATAVTVVAAVLHAAGARPPQPGRRHAVGLLVGAPVVAMASVAPAFWGTSAPPPQRVLLVPVYVLVVATVIGGALLGLAVAGAVGARGPARWAAGRGAALRPALAAPLVALILAPLPAVTLIGTHLGAMANYAAAKDGQASALLAARRTGQRAITLDAVPTADLGVLSYDRAEELARDPRCWINQAIGDYYGVATVTVVGGSAAGGC